MSRKILLKEFTAVCFEVDDMLKCFFFFFFFCIPRESVVYNASVQSLLK